jgi:tripartite ATP-independent transporter DctP family solute receptor
MKRRYTAFVFALVGFLAGLLAPGVTLAQDKKITAKLADILAPDHPHSRTWQFFADRVKEKTNGKVEIQVFHSAQLGQTKDLYQSLQLGNLELAKMPTAFAGEWIQEVRVFDLPYLFRDRDSLWRTLKGPVGKKLMEEIYPKHNVVGVMWVDDGGRSIYTHKPVRKPEDLKGLKIRVQPSEVHIQSLNLMGGIGTPTAFGEVYLAIQQKVLDGSENSPVVYLTSKHWEVAKVYSLTEQFWSISTLLANKKWWDGLGKENQDALRAAAMEAEKHFIEIYTADEAKAIGQLKEKGVQVITDVDKAAFEKRIQPAWDTFVKKYGKDQLDQVLASTKK